MSRREVASQLDVHPDSVTRLLPDGLAGAVLRWGGSSKRMVFSRALVQRWDLARRCPQRAGGRGCEPCHTVLDDCQAAGAHLLLAGHGILDSCSSVDEFGERDCFAQKTFSQPCRQV